MSLMTLPNEIRLEIYRYLLVARRTRPRSTRASGHDLWPQILQTCHEVRAEAMDVFKRENVFIRVVHNSSRFEDMLRHYGIYSLDKPSHALDFQCLSFVIIIAFSSPEPWRQRCIMTISSINLLRMCCVLWLFSAVAERISSIEVQPFYSTIARIVPRRSIEEFLVPIRRLWQAENIYLTHETRTEVVRGPSALPTRMSWVPAEHILGHMQAFVRQANRLREAKEYFNSAMLYSKLIYMTFALHERQDFLRSNPFFWYKLIAWSFRFMAGFAHNLVYLGHWDHAIRVALTAHYLLKAKEDCPAIPISAEEIAKFEAWIIELNQQLAGATLEAT